MKNFMTIFVLVLTLTTSAFGAEKTLVCGGNKSDVMGAKLYIKLIKQENNKFDVLLERTTLNSKATINKKIGGNLDCKFSKVDARVLRCMGGTRTSPQFFSISIINELNFYGQETHFAVSAQSSEIKTIDQKKLDISGIFNNSEEDFSESMHLNLNDDYGCSYTEQ